ncbi:hypothetical protein SAMD00019534_067860, partial [Acytostelium subglobosum LB1]|uniref:hypothetical protein n=1 Tax=Acytostelium subglobosum LB1 TaxID=1410327 RepID=UPI000644A0F9
MSILDKGISLSMVLFSISVFVYYTAWVIVSPFMDSDHWMHQYFLPLEYGVILPAILLVVGLAAIGSFLGMVMLKTKKK